MDVSGRVVRFMDNGLVVDIGNDIEGFVPANQVPLTPDQDVKTAVKEGQAADMKVLEVDPIHHRILLAITDFPAEQQSPPAPAPAAPESVSPEPAPPGDDAAPAPSEE
jgi:small subunit ribosomal protein S1